MSQLRVPAARPDHREGGRHGRQTGRPVSPAGRMRAGPPSDTRLRPRLLRTAVLPTLAAALTGATAVAFTVQTTGHQPSPVLWAVLAAYAVTAAASVAAAALGADRLATAVLDRATTLRRRAERDQTELAAVVEGIRRGDGPPPLRTARATAGPPPADEFERLARELGRFQDSAIAAVVQASRLSSSVGNEQKVEVFVNLARRLQSLVHREIQLLDDLENEVEDPDLLKGLFHVDHLATRIRRHAENLAVLGGAVSRRQWSHPVTMTEVLRSAIAEVEQYPRVKLVPPIDGTLRGHAVADVIHLLAELVENATLFSAPHTQVLLRAQYVTAGLAVEVEDRGLGMPAAEQSRMNALLADPDQVNVAHLLQDGRIGLFVVSALARRHGIAVRLQNNIYGGVQAVLVLPQGLLGSDPEGLAGGVIAATQSGRTRRAKSHLAPGRPDAVHTPRATPAHAAAAVADHHPHRGTPADTGPVGGHDVGADPHPVAPEDVPHTGPVPHPAVHPPHPRGPLPVRTEHPLRPTPAAALPGAGHRLRTEEPDDPHSAPTPHGYVPQRAAPPLTPPLDADTALLRPQLPRRRVQEHIVPQLRTPPPPRREDEHAVHDPGLMAAFRRGFGLAETAEPHPRYEQSHPAHPSQLSHTSHAPDAAPGAPRRHDTTSKE
ncbi:ATP-binding protein [Streptomyces sp. NPDC048057]|uniref:sensor histidine kinase n=1 Tax=Streptomyces sp. NPDC048057 TaxID=3155628 RepID=UPI0033DB40C6